MLILISSLARWLRPPLTGLKHGGACAFDAQKDALFLPYSNGVKHLVHCVGCPSNVGPHSSPHLATGESNELQGWLSSCMRY